METGEKQKWLLAGKIGKEARETGIAAAKPGAKLLDVAEAIEKKISDMGAKPSFPPNLSVNQIAAHYTPRFEDDKVLEKGDILKVDVGASVDGYLSDTAATTVVGEDDNDLVKASREALSEALKIAKPGVDVNDIGSVIERIIKSHGFSPIVNLGGHGIGRYDLHEEGFIPNISGSYSRPLKREGVIAIEPFATTGGGYVVDSSEVQILGFEEQKPVRSALGREILEFISSEYNKLPFAKRWIIKKFGRVAELELKSLVAAGALSEFHVLKEKNDGMVSQFEHTILFDGSEIIVTTA
ncbi:MAG: type II methionyl aminopeptidase [Candidatus Parvarchaeota archaeon]|jgi:methionyl aminopeptidase|nr:type II methionyl aminopeptidase [Candidatus Parvarchaeota archaeon]